MLTQKVLNQPKSTCVHAPFVDPLINVMQFLCTTTYEIFMTGTLFHSVVDGPSIMVSPSAAEDAVFKQAHINLSPEQKELLLWHY